MGMFQMNIGKKVVAVLLTSVAVMSLTGCKSEPSQDEVSTLVTKTILEGSQAAESMGVKVTVNSVKKISCKEDKNSDAFNCSVEADVTSSMAGRRTNTMMLKFVKDGDAWKIVG